LFDEGDDGRQPHVGRQESEMTVLTALAVVSATTCSASAETFELLKTEIADDNFAIAGLAGSNTPQTTAEFDSHIGRLFTTSSRRGLRQAQHCQTALSN
jgi:hypothetical protein